MAATVESFKEHINSGYTFKKDSIIIGAAIFNGTPVQGTQVKIPLKTLNRHGLIAGATGTGKTKTLQVIAEQMSLKGIPTLLMDLKGCNFRELKAYNSLYLVQSMIMTE